MIINKPNSSPPTPPTTPPIIAPEFPAGSLPFKTAFEIVVIQSVIESPSVAATVDVSFACVLVAATEVVCKPADVVTVLVCKTAEVDA